MQTRNKSRNLIRIVLNLFKHDRQTDGQNIYKIDVHMSYDSSLKNQLSIFYSSQENLIIPIALRTD